MTFTIFTSLLLVASSSAAGDPFKAGETLLEAPTFQSLGVRWYGEGDAEWKAKVSMEYRKSGAAKWLIALPLFRVEGEKCEPALEAGRALFAGSIFDLEAETEYEIRLSLENPGGAKREERFLRARTRAEPRVDPAARVLHAKPGEGGGAGTEGDPFRGLPAAQEAARPGDVIQLEPGVYSGMFQVTKSGSEGKPIAWRGSKAGETIIDGRGGERAIAASDIHDVYFLRLTIRGAKWGLVANGSREVYVNRCRFHDIRLGFTAQREGQKNITVTDCTFEGPSTWPRTKGIEETEGIEVQGDGNVVAHNRIHGFADAISICRGGSHSNDFYLNEISECTDDAIEMDYGGQNNRCFRNRCTNVFQGISVQPLLGGPCYVMRNAIYNLGMEPFKIHNGPSGILFFHNTTVKQGVPLLVYTHEAFSNSIFRNNLFIGTVGNYAVEIEPPNKRSDWDHDGFGGGPFKLFAKWNDKRYESLGAFTSQGGIEKHAVLVDAASAFASGLLPPGDVKEQVDVRRNDLRLKAGTRAIDAGEQLPNVNLDFKGSGPDLGAYELGAQLPGYGPRPEE